jgi:hypothetical protein
MNFPYFCTMKKDPIIASLFGAAMLLIPIVSFAQAIRGASDPGAHARQEISGKPYMAPEPGSTHFSPAYRFSGTGFFTTQVNVNTDGENILGDAANEPSIAVNPLDPDKMVIGWRQFDNVLSSFRQAGYGYSTNGGQNWIFPGVIEPNIFRSDPVLRFDSAGNFFYNSLTNSTGSYTCNVYKSTDGGSTWDEGVDAKGGDKQWMTIDVTDGAGSGNIYSCWNANYSSCYPGFFTRSANAGASFEECIPVDGFPTWGTMAVGPSGELYMSGLGPVDGVLVVKSSDAQIPGSSINWDHTAFIDLDGYVMGFSPINPVGLMGQVNVDVDRSEGPGRGNVYVLASVSRISVIDPADVMFARSTNGGFTFSAPKRLNTDAAGNYQWFGTMSVAPDGRIDVVWLDTRDSSGTFKSALYYCYSSDQGTTWSANKRISEQFDPQVGYPQQEKMGDYFDMVSDNTGAHLAWCNTLNGEQDVYYTHIIPSIVGTSETYPVQKRLSLRVSPNPFHGSAEISYELPAGCQVRIEMYNIHGKHLSAVFDGVQPAGSYTRRFNGEDLPPGFYLCRIFAGDDAETIRMIRIR